MLLFLLLQYFKKGAANVCCVVPIVNQNFTDEDVNNGMEDRLMPRTEELPLYSTLEFNNKVWAGRGATEIGVGLGAGLGWVDETTVALQTK